MIQKFDEYFLNEEKQVGIIYHYTDVFAFKEILDSNSLKTTPQPDYYISFTRNKNFHRSSYRDGNINGIDVRIVVDGNKLSNKYKISPYNYFGDSVVMNRQEGEVLSKFQQDNDEFEYEERVKAKEIKDLDKYVISYDVFEYESVVKLEKYMKQNKKIRIVKW